MDKGMKGLLTGDLSVFLLQQIQKNLDKFDKDLNKLASQIQSQFDKKEVLD